LKQPQQLPLRDINAYVRVPLRRLVGPPATIVEQRIELRFIDLLLDVCCLYTRAAPPTRSDLVDDFEPQNPEQSRVDCSGSPKLIGPPPSMQPAVSPEPHPLPKHWRAGSLPTEARTRGGRLSGSLKASRDRDEPG
jgi:hypothetical protein